MERSGSVSGGELYGGSTGIMSTSWGLSGLLPVAGGGGTVNNIIMITCTIITALLIAVGLVTVLVNAFNI